MTASDHITPTHEPAPGWIGGFEASDPAFAYPEPDLSSLELTGNMDNIDRIQRQVDVLWPEFSWETVQGDPSSRCYSLFAPDISRIGYDDFGRVWAFICPQQGAYSPTLGDFNVEITVNKQRGWVNEGAKDLNYDLVAAGMEVEGKIWFGPLAKDKLVYNLIAAIFRKLGLDFPLDKAHAIRLRLPSVDDATQNILPVRSGLSTGFETPGFTLHYVDGDGNPEAFAVGNLQVQIGDLVSTGNPIVDEFNALVLDVFNYASGNMLQKGNVLSWNVWFDAPTIVPAGQKEWREHAEKWRHSIDTGHVTPDGPSIPARYFDGTFFKPIDAVVQAEADKIMAWVRKHI